MFTKLKKFLSTPNGIFTAAIAAGTTIVVGLYYASRDLKENHAEGFNDGLFDGRVEAVNDHYGRVIDVTSMIDRTTA